MTNDQRRREAAARVRGMYPPLPVIFAALRESLAPEPAVPEQPEPAPEANPGDDLLDMVLYDAARMATGDADDVAFALALAVEHSIANAVHAGAREAHDAGVPGGAPVPVARAIDAILTVLHPYAAAVAAGDIEEPHGLGARLVAVARSAGVVEAVAGTGWSAVQRFGEPFCPRGACYGRNGSLLTDERIARDGFPPYGDGCNCLAVAADLP